MWNGQNLVGIDPRLILLQEHAEGPHFDLLSWIQHRQELCRVFIRKTDISFVRRYPMLVHEAGAGRGNIVGYEVALDFNGLPFEWIPRTAAEVKGAARYQLISVNDAEEAHNPCRHLVTRFGRNWQLSGNGINLLDLLTF